MFAVEGTHCPVTDRCSGSAARHTIARPNPSCLITLDVVIIASPPYICITMVKGHHVGDPNQSGEFLNFFPSLVSGMCQTLSSHAAVLAQLGEICELGYNYINAPTDALMFSLYITHELSFCTSIYILPFVKVIVYPKMENGHHLKD